MKTKQPSGQALIIFETDLSQSEPFDMEGLTPIQRKVFDSLSEKQKDQIGQGFGAVYKDLGTNTEICSFNMEHYKPPKENLDSLARFLAEACRKYYSDPENVKKYEEWKKQRDAEETSKGRKNF